MDEAVSPFDLLLQGGRVLDPAEGVDDVLDIGIRAGRIAAVAPALTPSAATNVIDVTGKVVTPGLIDLHTHVFAHTTGFGLDVDDAGVNAGVTTTVDMGSIGTWWFPTFKAYVIDQAATNVVAFLMMSYVGATWRVGGPAMFDPDWGDPESLATMHELFPDLVRGFKTWGESGSTSLWGYRYLEMGRKAADLAELPLYIHTGELYPVDESNRPDPATVMPQVLTMARPGDVLGHCYSGMPDGILGRAARPYPALLEAIDNGVHLDVGHGINFSFETAKRMMDGGVLPYTISSDSHANLTAMHDDTTCSYSLVGTMSKLLALGMTLPDVIACTTSHPAVVLGKEGELGTLQIGTRADVSVLEARREPWTFIDPGGHTLDADERLVPTLVVREGTTIVPTRRLLRDVLEPAERGELGRAVAVGGRPR
jgi:dihydroorotase